VTALGYVGCAAGVALIMFGLVVADRDEHLSLAALLTGSAILLGSIWLGAK
jgi:hypothetical protein